VSGPASFAFGNARVRARRSRLLGPEDAASLRARGAEAPGEAAAPHPLDTARALLAAVVADYAVVLRSYPGGCAGLVRALLGRHEVENLKLAWRGLARGLPWERWAPAWRPLGALALLRAEDWREVRSLHETAGPLRGTPYEEIGTAMLRAHEADPAGAEMALDLWASRRIVDAARRLPAREALAVGLALSIVRERDVDSFRRAILSYGIEPDMAAGATALLREELGVEALRALAEWTPESGALGAHLPPAWGRLAGVREWEGLQLALRRERREACRRAFLASPFRLAPAVAFLLLREEEARGLRALAEAEGGPEPAAALERMFAASAMGA
jgi:hypothetical protein